MGASPRREQTLRNPKLRPSGVHGKSYQAAQTRAPPAKPYGKRPSGPMQGMDVSMVVFRGYIQSRSRPAELSPKSPKPQGKASNKTLGNRMGHAERGVVRE